MISCANIRARDNKGGFIMNNNQTMAMPGFLPRIPCPPGKSPTRESAGQVFVNSKIANESYTRLGQKTMIGFYTLKNGHEIVTSYQYTDAGAFDEAVAVEQCRKQASKEVWDLYSFYTQEARHHIDDEMIDTGEIPYGPLRTPDEVLGDKEARDVLRQNIKTAEKLVSTDYTETSWSALQIVLAVAKELVDNPTATAEEIYEVNEALVDAMIALVLAEPEEVPAEETAEEVIEGE
jgi:hypothetical protein